MGKQQQTRIRDPKQLAFLMASMTAAAPAKPQPQPIAPPVPDEDEDEEGSETQDLRTLNNEPPYPD